MRSGSPVRSACVRQSYQTGISREEGRAPGAHLWAIRIEIDLTSKHLGGFTNNVYTYMTPETWYLTK